MNRAIHRTGVPLPLLGDETGLAAAIVFVPARIGKFVGHAIAGTKPSFVDDKKLLRRGCECPLHFINRRAGFAY